MRISLGTGNEEATVTTIGRDKTRYPSRNRRASRINNNNNKTKRKTRRSNKRRSTGDFVADDETTEEENYSPSEDSE